MSWQTGSFMIRLKTTFQLCVEEQLSHQCKIYNKNIRGANQVSKVVRDFSIACYKDITNLTFISRASLSYLSRQVI